MEIVGLAPRLASAYPHELDGGRRQRIGIARTLILNPEFVVCDEPVSALDVSIQAQILNLLMDLQEDRNLTYIFITHDLSVVKHISDEIMVMYLGKCVEYAPADEIFEHPQHPYTRALLNAIPIPSIESCHKRRELLQGEVTSPIIRSRAAVLRHAVRMRRRNAEAVLWSCGRRSRGIIRRVRTQKDWSCDKKDIAALSWDSHSPGEESSFG